MALLNFGDDGSIIEPETIASPDVVPADMVQEWQRLKRESNEAAFAELTMRKAIVDTFFAGQAEGGKTKKDTDGNSVAATIVVNRRIDRELLTVRAEQFREAGINIDELIKYTPELIVGPYRKLADDKRAIFEEVLTISDGTPQLKVEAPKPKKGKKK